MLTEREVLAFSCLTDCGTLCTIRVQINRIMAFQIAQ